MADTTGAPGYIPLFGEDSPGTPVQDPLNSQATAVNKALKLVGYTTYTKFADLPATAAKGQHATVNGDSVTARNADYVYTGNGWARSAPIGFTSGTKTALTADSDSQVTVAHGLGATPAQILLTWRGPNTNSEWTVRVSSRDSTNFTVALYYNGSAYGKGSPTASSGFDWMAIA